MSPTIRLLYAEDNPPDADLTRIHFAGNAPEFAIEIVDTGEAFLRRSGEQVFDVLLLDNHLPDTDGVGLLQELNARGNQVPVVMVTGAGDVQTVVQTLRLGASDYIAKRAGYLKTLPDVLRAIVKQRGDDGLTRPAIGSAVRRVLYVEHHQMDIDLTKQRLAQSAPHLSLQAVTSSEEALRLLTDGRPFDLVLVDLRMPEMDALELLQAARYRDIRAPFIVTTGMGDEEAAVAALKLGAYDYLVKRENYLFQLPHAIENAIHRYELDQGSRRLQRELVALNKALEAKVQERTAQLHASSERLRDLSRKIIEVQEEERRHLARELHDELGQVLCAVSLDLKNVQLNVDPAASTLLDESIRIVDEAIGQVRSLSLDLRPSMLDEFGLETALHWYVKRYAERTGTIAQLTAKPVTDLSFAVRNAFFRVAQEALTNISRHARAGHVWIELRQEGDTVKLTIRDDGVGFDVTAARQRAARSASLGLLSMQERMVLLGGNLEIGSKPGHGTTVSAWLAMPDSDDEELVGGPNKAG